MTVAELVHLVHRERRRPGTSLGVTRASLSRTLRRLWREGLVELLCGWRTMTEEHQRVLSKIAEHEADPVAAYQGYQAFVQSIGLADRHGSVEAFMSAQRARKPDLRVTRVQITAAGRARLTPLVPGELTDENQWQR